MKKIILMVMVACAIPAATQNWTTVSATNITDLNQQKLATGQLCFLGTDQNDVPVSFNVGGGGQILKRPFCASVANGAVSSFTVPNPVNTAPAGIYYRVTVKDVNTGQDVLRYTQVSFSGTTFNFDNYAPVVTGQFSPPSGNAVNGNLSVSGNAAITGTLAASNIPGGQLDTGTGTNNTLPKFINGPSGVIGNSSISDNGTTVSIGEPLSISSGGANFSGSTSGSTALKASATASGTLTLPAATDTVAVLGTAQTWGAANQTNMQLVTPKIGGTAISNVPVLTWTIDNGTGNINFTSGAFSQFTPISGITIKRIEVIVAGTAAAGCTTSPIVRITDGTTNLDTSITNGTLLFSANFTQNYSAGATLQMKTIAGAGCTANPTGPFVTVQYTMQ